MKVIGIVGSRTRNSPRDKMLVEEQFDTIYEDGDWLCSGDCRQGADAFALQIARKRGIPILSFPPGVKGGNERFFIRNDLIAYHSDVLIACVVQPFDIEARGGTNFTCRAFRIHKPVSWESKLFIV